MVHFLFIDEDKEGNAFAIIKNGICYLKHKLNFEVSFINILFALSHRMLYELLYIVVGFFLIFFLSTDNEKALFRRGKAHAAVWNVTEARRDLMRVAELNPKLDVTVHKELAALESRLKEKEAQEKSSFSGMFSS